MDLTLKHQDFRMMTKFFIVLLSVVSVHSAPRTENNVVKDCDDMYKIAMKAGTEQCSSGVFTIYPSVLTHQASLLSVQAHCDMHTEGGRWTVIQRRFDGSLNFYRPWEQYKAGFGDAKGEYWLGLEAMHLLTLGRKHELRVDLEDFEGNRVFAKYSTFSVGSEAEGYKLTVAGFKNGGAKDSFSYHNGAKFSTFDKDQDTWSKNCAVVYNGANWYKSCHHNNVNGVYQWGPTTLHATGVNWYHWKGWNYSLKAVSMKIRPVH